MRNRNTQGFTLIELLIVIAIIGILAAVLIPNLLAARERAFDTAAQSCLKEVATAEEVDFIDNGFYTQDATAFTISACEDSTGASYLSDGTHPAAAGDGFQYTAEHPNGSSPFFVNQGGGVERGTP